MTELVGVKADLHDQREALVASPIVRIDGNLFTPTAADIGRPEWEWQEIDERDAVRFADLFSEPLEFGRDSVPDISPHDRILLLPPGLYERLRDVRLKAQSPLAFRQARPHGGDMVWVAAGSLECIWRFCGSIVAEAAGAVSTCISQRRFREAKSWVDLGLAVVVGRASRDLELLWTDALVLEMEAGASPDTYERLRWRVALLTRRSREDVELSVQTRRKWYEKRWPEGEVQNGLVSISETSDWLGAMNDRLLIGPKEKWSVNEQGEYASDGG